MLSIWSLSANANSISLTRCFLVGLSSEALFSPDSMSSEKASIVSTSWKYIHASLGDSIETYSAQEKITVTDTWISMFSSFPPVQDGILTNKCLQCYNNNNNNHFYWAALQQSLQHYVLQSKNIIIYLAHPRIRWGWAS